MSGILNFTSPSLSFGSTSVSVEPLEKDPQKVPFVAWYVGDKLFYRVEGLGGFCGGGAFATVAFAGAFGTRVPDVAAPAL